jgi:hypothetical protein
MNEGWTARPPPQVEEARTADDPRRAWTTENRDGIVELHEQGKSPFQIAESLGLPAREIVELIRQFCTVHTHFTNATVRAHLE